MKIHINKVLAPEVITELTQLRQDASPGVQDVILGVISASNALDRKHDEAERDFRAYARLFGLKEDALGTTFVAAGKAYTVTGLSPSRPKYPINAEQVGTGKSFKFPLTVAETINAAVKE